MKKLLTALLVVALLAAPVFAEPHDEFEGVGEKEPEIVSICPKTKVQGKVGDCLLCHSAPNWKLKEAAPDEARLYQNMFRVRTDKNGEFLYIPVEDVIGQWIVNQMVAMEEYLSWHPKINRIRLEITSPGGSFFAGTATVGIITRLKASGIKVETYSPGFAASAAFYIFASGSERRVGRTAEFMWHELRSWDFFAEKNPSKLKDEARIYRHLQDTCNSYLASVSKMSKVEIDKAVDKDELWLRGEEMIRHGFADGYIGE